jgi:DNA repair exonuclease SbcCD nuclease subunit
VLKILHTADWHVGLSFKQFEPEDARKLSRDRLSVVDQILGRAEQYNVDAVLCAGDLFDTPQPNESWWRRLAESFNRRRSWTRPVVLLPGNHDPLTDDSVYNKNHDFRKNLPDWVQVVDREDFQLELPQEAVIYAAPCRTKAGDKDLALSLPSRADGDTRVRIGLVHGSSFDMEGYATNFPVSRDAPQKRGLDYLAAGDWHSFREIPEGAVAPIVYPSAPEPTKFGEPDSGFVALVSFARHGIRPRVQRERVARWTWRDETVRRMADLKALADEDLVSTVLRITLDLTVSVSEMKEAEDILNALKGTEAANPRAGAFVCDRSKLRLEVGNSPSPGALPPAVRAAWARLTEEARTSPEAARALVILQRLVHEAI